MSNKVFTLKNTEDLSNTIKDLFLPSDSGATVVFLSGDLGAGKTTFVQKFADYVNVRGRVVSPTFNILKEYVVEGGGSQFSKLIHIDLYRIESVEFEDLEALGINDYLSSKGVIMFVEWPERIVDQSLTPNYWIKLSIVSEETRQLSIEKL
jgi:tRNA threonylcarbamoyladenosine biosynthesis protein TsaE